MFNKLTQEQLSYMIGLFHGDGSLYETTRNRGKMSYEIPIRDKDIIDKLAEILGPLTKCTVTARTRNTNFKVNYTSIRLTIHAKEFRDQLKEYMPSSKKSASIVFDNRLSFKHYLRGLTDADGSLGIANTMEASPKAFWSLCTSSESVKDDVCILIEKLTGLVKRINRNTRDGVYNIVLYNEDAQIMCNHLYNDSTIFLDRKHEKLKLVNAWKRTIPKRKGRAKSWTETEDRLILDNKYTLEDKMKLTKRTAQSIKTRLWRLNKK